ncbi:hypothetical protein CTEN210_10360 [Chaetoceros tenuissimus]|uniref:Uncharacterized protein n=1 Tax=Chaetoceros tenuissimus TaxID=426638 RepID=A0AAD3H8I6_9STRA|nr:hypothetical protein CTEN210_10360 [Chaetoceros tenuissimus]
MLQGSVNYLVQILSALPQEMASQAVVLITNGNRRRLRDFGLKRFTKIPHRHVGGALDHVWWIGSAQELHIPAAKVHAQLRDMLKCTEEGSFYSGEMNTPAYIPLARINDPVICPSVLVRSGKVRRKITSAEALDLYDVEVQYQHFTSIDFKKQAPGKITYGLMESVLKARSVLSKKREVEDTGSDVPSAKKARVTQILVEEDPQIEDVREDPTVKSAKATKSDDAEVQVDIWNRRMFQKCLSVTYQADKHAKMCDMLRRVMLRFYQRKIYASFRKYLHKEHGAKAVSRYHQLKQNKKKKLSELEKDIIVGTDAIRRASEASYWEWTSGSTLFFWRWPECYQQEVRDGLAVTLLDKPPVYWKKSRWPEDDKQLEAMRKKIKKVADRGYIKDGEVDSLISFFAVPKGEEDIRMVYDATKCGLNEVIWSPNFFLPTVATVVRSATPDTFFGDIDLGEMFLNYFLDEDLRSSAGVDVTNIADLLEVEVPEGKRLIMRWERNLMGLKSSLYNCIRTFLWSEDFIRGDRKDSNNPLRWDTVVTNLPGSADYDPTKPWIYRWDETNKRIAASFCSYVDDIRTWAQGEDHCNEATRTIAAKINYLGQQDAPRKRREVSQAPGAWAGATVETVAGEGVYASILPEKWNKARDIVEKWLRCAPEEEEEDWKVNRKELEKDTGFLIHVCLTFENFKPYLKGFYNTLNGWRWDRDSDGWKRSNKDWKQYWEDLEAGDGTTNGVEWTNIGSRAEHWSDVKFMLKEEHQDDNAPVFVKGVPRFKQDLRVLSKLLESETPSKRLIRGSKIWEIIYGFGDASGSGFGMSWEKDCKGETTGRSSISYRFGRWGSDMDDSSSNLRELKNLVQTLEKMGEKELEGVEMFLFTDNSTAEAAFYKGSSSSEWLFDLVVRLSVLEMTRNCKIHIIHVAGTRMIAQGADGLSRGALTEGVMKGEAMKSFVPLHQSALDRDPALEPWLRDWFESAGRNQGQDLEFLSMEDWFERGHDILEGSVNVDGQWVPNYVSGNFVWSPPPSLALPCLEEIRRARHKRQESTHIFICPRLMTPAWKRHLHKAADIILELPPGHAAWSVNMFEPLLIAIFFPFLNSRPWQLKGSPALLELGRKVQQVFKGDESTKRHVLRELWNLPRRLQGMSDELVLRVLRISGEPRISSKATGKRRRSKVEENKRLKPFQSC